MRAVVQRVSGASVAVDGEVIARVGVGFLVLVGVEDGDAEADAVYMADKLSKLRVFPDSEGKMNLSVLDTSAEILLVSQFTLLGDARKGNRPSFIAAAQPSIAEQLYLRVAALLQQKGISVQTGKFQAHMDVSLVNDGPVTILLDSRRTF